MQISLFELLAGLAGFVSVAFNFFQLYRERILRNRASADRQLHVTTLSGIWKGLTDARAALADLHHKGASADALESAVARSLESYRVQVGELLDGYYLNPAHSPSRNVGQDAEQRPSGSILVS